MHYGKEIATLEPQNFQGSSVDLTRHVRHIVQAYSLDLACPKSLENLKMPLLTLMPPGKTRGPATAVDQIYSNQLRPPPPTLPHPASLKQIYG